MDWYDIGPDTWMETAFGDVNTDGYFDIADDPTADPAGYVTALFPDFDGIQFAEAGAEAQWWDTGQGEPVLPAPAATWVEPDAPSLPGPVTGHLAAPPW